MESSVPKMAATTKEILSKVQRMIPPMLDKFHKGRWAGLISVNVAQETLTPSDFQASLEE